MFCASSNDLGYQFKYTEDPHWVVIDQTGAHLWDASTVEVLDANVSEYERRGKTVDDIGVRKNSKALRARIDGRLPAGH